MSNQTPTTKYSFAEEVAHATTHGLGIPLSIAALVVLVALASVRGNAWHVVACSIYGATLVLLYTASTLYHAVPQPRAKGIFRALDHMAIYLLIAGTYTPFLLIYLRGGWGWSLMGIVWGLALVGVARELGLGLRMRGTFLSALLYLGLGWVAVVAVRPIFHTVPTGCLVLLLMGGLAYSGGVVFFCWGRVPFNHAIWHLFVLAGSLFHFCAVLYYVIPATTA